MQSKVIKILKSAPLSAKLKQDWAMEQKKHVSPDRLPFSITAPWPLN